MKNNPTSNPNCNPALPNNSNYSTSHTTSTPMYLHGATGFPISSLSFNSISYLRQKALKCPHPCLSFFISCYKQDSKCKAYYDGNHVITYCEGILFDEQIFYNSELDSNFIELKKESLRNIINSFDKLSNEEIEILIRYLK